MDHPVCGYVHQVDVVAIAKLLVGLRPDISVSFRQAGFLEDVIADVNPLLFEVAESHNLDSIDLGVSADRRGTPASDSHESDPDCLDGVALQSEGALLPGRALGSLQLYHAVFDNSRHGGRNLLHT